MYRSLLPPRPPGMWAILLAIGLAFSIAGLPATGYGQLIRIEIVPSDVRLEVGDRQQFTAVAWDAGGQIIEFDPVWAASGGSITQKGLYTATIEGCFEIVAVDPDTGVVGKAEVHVECFPPEITRMAVSPERVELDMGDQVQFSAIGKGLDGEDVTVQPKWSASGGSISAEGLFTATQPGQFTVTASLPSSEVIGTARVFVKDPGLLGRWVIKNLQGSWCLLTGMLAGFILGLGAYFWRRRYRAGKDGSTSEPTNPGHPNALYSLNHSAPQLTEGLNGLARRASRA